MYKEEHVKTRDQVTNVIREDSILHLVRDNNIHYITVIYIYIHIYNSDIMNMRIESNDTPGKIA